MILFWRDELKSFGFPQLYSIKISKYKSVLTGRFDAVLSWAVVTKVPVCWKLDVIQDGDDFILIRSKQFLKSN